MRHNEYLWSKGLTIKCHGFKTWKNIMNFGDIARNVKNVPLVIMYLYIFLHYTAHGPGKRTLILYQMTKS